MIQDQDQRITHLHRHHSQIAHDPQTLGSAVPLTWLLVQMMQSQLKGGKQHAVDLWFQKVAYLRKDESK